MYNFGALRDKDELMGSTGQGHGDTKCGQKSILGLFCHGRTLNDS